MTDAIESLCRLALADSSPIVRRTAGDALSDLGDTTAMATMTQVLAEESKLMRWIAARFSNEIGALGAVGALHPFFR